jgi:hypothetical protein
MFGIRRKRLGSLNENKEYQNGRFVNAGCMMIRKKRFFVMWIACSLLLFGLASIPFENISIGDGKSVDSGLPLRWLTIQYHVLAPDKRVVTGEWWEVDRWSLSAGCLIVDLTVAALAGIVPSALFVRARQRKNGLVSKEVTAVSP